MKRTISLLLAALLLGALLCGCDLQNRRPSSEFVPDMSGYEPPEWTIPTEPETTEPRETVVMQATVRDAIVTEGDYVDRYGNEYTYNYRVPFIDAESRYAQNCNREIDQQFTSYVNSARSAMANGSTIDLLTVDYKTRFRSDFLTLYVYRTDIEGEEFRAVYNVNSVDGSQVLPETILAYLGLDEELFLEAARQTVETFFEDNYGDYTWDTMVQYNQAKDRTMRDSNFTLDLPLYIDENDDLVIVAPVYDLAGEKHSETLVVEYQELLAERLAQEAEEGAAGEQTP